MSNTLPSGYTFLQRLAGSGQTRESAWRLLYEKYWDFIIYFSMGRGLRRAEAEIVLQETMARLLIKLPQFREGYPLKGTFRSYVIGIAKHVCFEEFKRRATNARRHESLDAGGVGSDPARPSSSLELADSDMRDTLRSAEEAAFKHSILRQALEELRPSVDAQTWAVFVAYVQENGEAGEVATRFGLKLNNVYQIKNRLSEQLRILAERIRGEMDE